MDKTRLREFLLIIGVALFGMFGLAVAMLLTTAHAAMIPPTLGLVSHERVFRFEDPLETLQIRIIENASRTVKGSIWSVRAKSRTLLANCSVEKTEYFSTPSLHPKLVYFECKDSALGMMRAPLILSWENAQQSPQFAQASLGSSIFGMRIQGKLRML